MLYEELCLLFYFTFFIFHHLSFFFPSHWIDSTVLCWSQNSASVSMGLARTFSSYSGQNIGVTLESPLPVTTSSDILSVLPSEYISAHLIAIVKSPHTDTSNPLYATPFSAQSLQNSIIAFYFCVFIMFMEYCLSSLIHAELLSVWRQKCVVQISAVRGNNWPTVSALLWDPPPPSGWSSTSQGCCQQCLHTAGTKAGPVFRDSLLAGPNHAWNCTPIKALSTPSFLPSPSSSDDVCHGLSPPSLASSPASLMPLGHLLGGPGLSVCFLMCPECLYKHINKHRGIHWGAQ